LLPRLVLLLVRLQQHIVRQRASRHRTLRAHRVALAGQGPGTLRAVGQRDAALLLDVDGALGLGDLGLGLLLFLLLLGLPPVALVLLAVRLALLALLGPVAVGHALDGALLGALLPLHRVLPVGLVAAVDGGRSIVDGLAVLTDTVFAAVRGLLLGAVRGVAGLLLLARLLLLRPEAAADVLRGGLLQHGPLAVLADDRLELVLPGVPRGEGGHGLLVHLGQDGGGVGRAWDGIFAVCLLGRKEIKGTPISELLWQERCR